MEEWETLIVEEKQKKYVYKTRLMVNLSDSLLYGGTLNVR